MMLGCAFYYYLRLIDLGSDCEPDSGCSKRHRFPIEGAVEASMLYANSHTASGKAVLDEHFLIYSSKRDDPNWVAATSCVTDGIWVFRLDFQLINFKAAGVCMFEELQNFIINQCHIVVILIQ